MNGWSLIIIPMFRDVSVLSVYQCIHIMFFMFMLVFLLCKLFQDHCYYFSNGTEIDHHRLYGPDHGQCLCK